MKQFSFFKNVLNIIIISFNVNDDHDEINCDANENSKTINDDVNDDDDDVRRKRKSTKIVS